MDIIYLKAALLCLFAVLATSLVVETVERPAISIPAQSAPNTPSLGFGNQTGANTTAGQVTSFINFINSASTYFSDDAEARLNYISDQLNSSYGVSGEGFSVIQAGNEGYSWGIYSYGYYASVAPGVDRIFPNNSYMFLRQSINSLSRVYFPFPGQKGYGIDSTLETVIKNTILSVETTSTCSCSGNSVSIRDLLNKYDGGSWSVFCSQYNTFYPDVYSYKGKYIHIRPKNCCYVIYDN
jgi:hypothetical protein